MMSDLSKPLTDRDIGELDEILAAIPETHDPLDVALLDGFLVGVLLQPDLVLPSAWLPLVFDAQGGEAALPDLPTASRATELVMRRYNELAACIAAREPFDPIVFELENESGEVLTGREGIAALAAWAAGFANAFDVFASLRMAAAGDDELAGLLTGILRHLPEDPDAPADERPNLMRWSWWPDYNDAWNEIYPNFHTDSITPNGSNAMYYSNADVDALLDKTSGSIGEAEYNDAIAEMNKIMVEDDPAAIFVGSVKWYSVLQQNIKGFVPNPIYINTYNVYDMYREE